MRYGLIGEHLGHSFSKTIHERIGEYPYDHCEIAPSDLDGFLRAKGFTAINVTIPYKRSVIPHLDWMSPEVKAAGACNAVVNRDGRLYGYNTDYMGMRDLLASADMDVEGRNVLILGTGATSLTALALVRDLGAARVFRASRRQSDAADIVTYDNLEKISPDVHIIVNTTPCGMFPDTEAVPVDISLFPNLEGVADVIYNPLRSRLVVDALEMGIPAVGGLYMLVSQALHANAVFMDHGVYGDLCHTIYGEMLSEKENVCLIGMPSSGKTTVGRMVAKSLGRPFHDTDEIIRQRIGMSIPEYFRSHSEAEFRSVEREVIQEMSREQASVIATGGGSVLNLDNVRSLRTNSRIYFLDCRLENLMVTRDRPLTSSRDALSAKYKQRNPIYNRVCDVRIDANLDVADTAMQILSDRRAK
ncbi:MAG: shikimate dehydrogenase [Bacteroidales bacterium]|nr:shikimate dehydrogenase [Bacteroidales bacterium]